MRIRIVVAEDFPLVRDAVTAALRRDPAFEVVGEAETGREAIALAEQLRPDVLILDLVLPDLDGMAVLEHLRASQPQIRIVVLTASEEPGRLLQAIDAGAAGYLSKRSVSEELRQAVITAHGGGSVVTPELAIHLLREFSGSTRVRGSDLRPLRGRELEVLRLVARGKTDDEIGRELHISPRTVQSHLERIRDRTGLRRRSELARWAAERAIA